VIDVLINSSRAFIYSTAPPPAVAKALVRALDIVEGEPERRERLWQRVRLAGVALGEVAGGGQGIAPSQILPVVLGSEERTLRVAKAVQGAGYDVRAIRPPTVPAGTSRLRIVINANHGESDISGLAAALGDALANGTR
jgi:8-amino-7-oxononanoate synthase